MYISTKIRSGPTASTVTLSFVPYTSYDVTKTALDNTITPLFAKLHDKLDKQDEKLEYINALIANQDTKIDEKNKTATAHVTPYHRNFIQTEQPI